MEVKYYKLDNEVFQQINKIDFRDAEKSKNVFYLVDIRTHNRELATKELLTIGIDQEICEFVKDPSEHIRFEYYGNILHGELAQFSTVDNKSTFSSLIIKDNIFIGIHPEMEHVLTRLEQFFKRNTAPSKTEFNTQQMLFTLILEILSNYGKLIITYRDEIERLALSLDDIDPEVTPEDIRVVKSKISEFSRVIERLYFTLSFPPTKDVLNANSTYAESFNYLLKSTDLLQTSIKNAEERLDSINDHYQLLLHNKSTKRLNLLTIIQAVFVPLTFIAGIYGMNFKYMPELEMQYGYFITLGAMVLFGIISLYFFIRKGWFDD